jgi:tRNA-guanine family transglycosylase
VKFKSHDWFVPLFTPENVMEIQRTIGADIIMAFDECTRILVITVMRSVNEDDTPLVRPMCDI